VAHEHHALNRRRPFPDAPLNALKNGIFDVPIFHHADDVTFLAAHPVRQSKQQDGAEQPETAEQAALRRMARNATLAAPEPPPSEEELKPPGAA